MSCVEEREARGWLYLINPWATQNKYELQVEAKKDYQGTSGKYLFFSSDKKALMDLGKQILEELNLYLAKVPLANDQEIFVLCVYDVVPRYKYVLRRYDGDKIKYRWWKSNRRTLEQAERR